MSEKYVHLIGTEEVRRAGGQMQDAAESMRAAAAHISESIDRLDRILNEFATRMESIKPDTKEEA